MDAIDLATEIDHHIWVLKCLALGEYLDERDVYMWYGAEKRLLGTVVELCQEWAVIRGLPHDRYSDALKYAEMIPALRD